MAASYAAAVSSPKHSLGASLDGNVDNFRVVHQRLHFGSHLGDELHRGLKLDLNDSSRRGPRSLRPGRDQGSRRLHIVAASPPGEEVAVRPEPLTKQDLVAYLASGCKPKEKWRSVFCSCLLSDLISLRNICYGLLSLVYLLHTSADL